MQDEPDEARRLSAADALASVTAAAAERRRLELARAAELVDRAHIEAMLAQQRRALIRAGAQIERSISRARNDAEVVAARGDDPRPYERTVQALTEQADVVAKLSGELEHAAAAAGSRYELARVAWTQNTARLDAVIAEHIRVLRRLERPR